MKKTIVNSVLVVSMLSTTMIADEVKVADVEAEYAVKTNVESSKELNQSINRSYVLVMSK